MRRSMTVSLTTLAVALSLSLLLPAAANAQKGSSYMCDYKKGLPRSPRATFYSTEILPMNGAAYADISRAWFEYIKANYEPDAAASIAECFQGDQPAIGQSRSFLMSVWSAAKQVQTGWSYKSGMTATPSKPGAVYAFCMSGSFGGDKTVYETPVFEIPDADAHSTTSPVEVTFTKYMIKKGLNKYPFQQWYSMSVGCPHSFDSKTIAEERRIKAENDYKKLGKSLVQTGWVYARNADTPAANAGPRNSH
jgi:hypothetical protein